MVPAFSVSLVLLLPCLAFAPEDPPSGAGADPAAGIEWERPEGAGSFQEAQKAWGEKDYKGAHKLFKKAADAAKSGESRTRVESWVTACAGAVELKVLREMAADPKKLGDTLRQAEAKLETYLATPIAGEYQAFVAELGAKIYVSLENFDKPSGRYSESQGKKFIKDKQWVKQGTHSLKWDVGSNPAELKVKEIPGNLSEFKAVAFWLHFPEGGGPSYDATFMGEGKSQADMGKDTHNGYKLDVKAHSGWRRVELSLKDFKSFGSIDWGSVQDFRIRFETSRTFTVYVDDIVLVRK